MKAAWVFVAIIVAIAVLPYAARGQYPWCEDMDQIFATAEDSTITVHHYFAAYNCCPDGFSYAATQQGMRLNVSETEILTMPCPCLCCYNLAVEIAPVAPGAYTLAFRWYDYETGQWQVRELPVIVPAGPLGAAPAIAAVTASDCLEPSAVGDPPSQSAVEASTWGAIKSTYR